MTKPKNTDRGRPPKPEHERRVEWIGAAVTKQEKHDFEARAKAMRKSKTAYLRMCVGLPT